MTDKLPAPRPDQRGRASIAFLAHLYFGAAKPREQINQALDASFVVDELPEDLDERDAAISAVMETLPAYRVQQTIGEWHSRAHGHIAVDTFEARADELVPALEKLDSGPATLVADPQFQPPDYWDGVHYHRTAGGWDGHAFMGYIHGEIIHREMVAALFPGSIMKQRRDVAAMAPRDDYERILDMGCSTAHYTMALAQTYPNATITGVDLSIKTLEHARRIANAHGYDWRLHLRAAEDTGFDSESFDLVTSYILLHEMPADAIERMFAEAFRLLAPGGDLIMSDVSRYGDLDKLSVWRADRGARYGGEPHWRASASMDMGAALRAAGFIDVTAGGVDGANYPYVIQGTKPEAGDHG